jgi:hypothetical protein
MRWRLTLGLSVGGLVICVIGSMSLGSLDIDIHWSGFRQNGKIQANPQPVFAHAFRP